MTYLLDTNAVTALLKANPTMNRKMREALDNGDSIRIGGISFFEIKRGLLAASAGRQLIRFENLCRAFGIVLFDDIDIFDEAARIYADLKNNGNLIGDADILIAALSKVNKTILVTDDSDFQRIKGLRTENWIRE